MEILGISYLIIEEQLPEEIHPVIVSQGSKKLIS